MTMAAEVRVSRWVRAVNAAIGAGAESVETSAEASADSFVRGAFDFTSRFAPVRGRVPRTKVLFLTHYFPPEGNAPASRVHEMCKRWVRDGHEVTVLTGVPNHPNGIPYTGYHNWPIQHEYIDGIRVIRVWTFLAANRGRRRRALNFISYLFSATLAGLFIRRRDVLIATSPQFFCGWAGMLISAIRRVPFILEVRDIWPESIQAVGLSKRNTLIWLLERMERQMYAAAFRIVTVGDGYRRQLLRRDVASSKIEVVTNGVDRELFAARLNDQAVRTRYGLHDQFICAYVGTVGMASGLEVVLRAARLLKQKRRTDITFMLVGDGASRQELEEQAKTQGLDNIIFAGRVEKRLVPRYIAAADACLVHLRKKELFESVLPSKMFEAAGMAKPIILGVRGCAAELVRDAEAGVCIEPENEKELVEAIESLAADYERARRFGRCGQLYVRKHFDRDKLARRYFRIIRRSIEICPIVV